MAPYVAGTGAARGRPLPKVVRVAYSLGAVLNHFFVTYRTQPRNVAVRRDSGVLATGRLLGRHFCGDVAGTGTLP